MADRPLALVTGASTGIGYELAKLCVEYGFDVVMVADEPAIESAAQSLMGQGAQIRAITADLATTEGVEHLCRAAREDGRPIAALFANAGIGLGGAFLDQDFAKARRVVDTNVTGTIHLIHTIGRQMRERNEGKILITGSIAGFIPGSFQAVYNGSKAFLDNFAYALANELKETSIDVSLLMPGPTATEFFRRAEMLNTSVGEQQKDDAAKVARDGFDALMRGESDVVSGWKNKLVATLANITPAEFLAERHRAMAEPGSARR
jgi:uncharacterized protein